MFLIPPLKGEGGERSEPGGALVADTELVATAPPGRASRGHPPRKRGGIGTKSPDQEGVMIHVNRRVACDRQYRASASVESKCCAASPGLPATAILRWLLPPPAASQPTPPP